jgi:RloB-like protein
MGKSGKPRRSGDLTRRSKGFKELRRILIVCEGAKTEPNYFRALVKSLALRAASVEVVGEECESAPISVYRYADKRFAEDGGYDEVHCVIDRDRHSTFAEAIDAIRRHRSRVFRAVVSYPCFEYWVLLHFRYTRSAFVGAGASSPGDMVVRAVKDVWPTYTKGAENAFQHLADKKDTALAHAKRARRDFEDVGNENPSTDVDKLVDALEEYADNELKPADKRN